MSHCLWRVWIRCSMLHAMPAAAGDHCRYWKQLRPRTRFMPGEPKGKQRRLSAWGLRVSHSLE